MHSEPDPQPGDFDEELENPDPIDVEIFEPSTERRIIEADGVTELRPSAPGEIEAPDDPASA